MLLFIIIQANLVYQPSGLPRNAPVSINRRISGLCSLSDVGPVSPGNVTFVNSTIVGFPTESYDTGLRNIFAVIRVVWQAPLTLGSGVTSYRVRVATQPIEVNDTSASNEVNTVSANGEFELEQQHSFRDVPAGTVVVYIQVRNYIVDFDSITYTLLCMYNHCK